MTSPLTRKSADELALSDVTFASLRDLIYDASGLHFDELNKRVFERRLRARVRELGFRSFERYYLHLRFDPKGKEELERAIDALTVHETYFFREERALRAFRCEILPLLAMENVRRRSVRIWSAGCSTGEEAYTLAMLVHESGLFVGWQSEVIGSDISARAIARARIGVYERASFRAMNEERRARYFSQLEDGKWRVNDELRALTVFRSVNLIREETFDGFANFDVIFCRNVLLYFDDRARRRAALLLHRSLRDGGYLVLGAAETLASLDVPFRLVHLRNDLVYQKAG